MDFPIFQYLWTREYVFEIWEIYLKSNNDKLKIILESILIEKFTIKLEIIVWIVLIIFNNAMNILFSRNI